MPRQTIQRQPRLEYRKGYCALCSTKGDDEVLYGTLMTRDDLTVHYFCLMFASGLSQSSDDEELEFCGFLKKDILKELARVRRLRCAYCKKTGASIGCVVKKCRIMFHLPCGVRNGALNQYFDEFCSYCLDHRPRQALPSIENLASPSHYDATCFICLSSVDIDKDFQLLRTTCCRNSPLHKDCLQKQALSAGLFFFKCPLCNSKDDFQKEMQKYGIYIPERDALWELEENAFSELLERHSHCDAKNCLCPKGRHFNKAGARKWEVRLCGTCGAQGTHLACSDLKSLNDNWLCLQCAPINKKIDTKRNKEGTKKALSISCRVRLEDASSPSSRHHKQVISALNALTQVGSPRSLGTRSCAGLSIHMSRQEQNTSSPIKCTALSDSKKSGDDVTAVVADVLLPPNGLSVEQCTTDNSLLQKKMKVRFQ